MTHDAFSVFVFISFHMSHIFMLSKTRGDYLSLLCLLPLWNVLQISFLITRLQAAMLANRR